MLAPSLIAQASRRDILSDMDHGQTASALESALNRMVRTLSVRLGLMLASAATVGACTLYLLSK